jgi:hypothetical protein
MAAEKILLSTKIAECGFTEPSSDPAKLRVQARFISDLMALGCTLRKNNPALLSPFEREIIYSSDFLVILFKYLEL